MPSAILVTVSLRATAMVVRTKTFVLLTSTGGDYLIIICGADVTMYPVVENDYRITAHMPQC